MHGLTENNPLTLPLQANAFFELYLEDANQNLIDVPVLIKNFRDLDGASPNSSYDSGKSRLVHRFFVYDTISGIEKVGGYATNAPPAIIRYASSAKMTVQMEPGAQETIWKPLLELEYTEYETSLLTPTSEAPASMQFDYYESFPKYVEFAEIWIHVGGLALVALVVAMRMTVWVKLNPPRFLARHFFMSFVHRLFFYLLDTWSNVMFLIYWVVTMYWFIMYKMQERAYLLMPQRGIDDSAYDHFFIALVVIIVAKTLAVLMTVLDQTQADVFVMDWERFEQMKLLEVNDNSQPAAANNNQQQ